MVFLSTHDIDQAFSQDNYFFYPLSFFKTKPSIVDPAKMVPLSISLMGCNSILRSDSLDSCKCDCSQLREKVHTYPFI